MSECIPWWGRVRADGYGYLPLGRQHAKELAHRFVWEQCFGPIPPKHDVHHRCGRKDCVNPEHLQTLTRSEHFLTHHRKTHCKWGHEYTPENTYVWRDGSRRCKRCTTLRLRELRARRKAEASV